MNLVDALREIAPVCGDGSADEARAEAARILYVALRDMARGTFRQVEPAVRDDVASEVLVRLMNNGPRGVRAGDPDTPAAVHAYLRRAIENGVRDWFRRNKRQVQTDDWTEFADERSGPAEEASRREAERDLVAAERFAFDELLPELTVRVRGGPALAETLRCLRDVRDGRTTIGEVLEAEGPGTSQDPAEARRARNRVDQRFSRALARVHAEVDSRVSDGRIPVESATWVRRILASLRLRG